MLPAILSVPVPIIARAMRLPVGTFLAEVERWSAGPGLPYGLQVDREAQTITVG